MEETLIAPETEHPAIAPATHDAGARAQQSVVPHAATTRSMRGEQQGPATLIIPNDCSCNGGGGTGNGNGGAGAGSGSNGGGNPEPQAAGFVYAIGGLRLAMPNENVSHELAAAADALEGVVPDFDLNYTVLSQGEYLYLAREICWVLQIDGAEASSAVDAYIVKPRTSIELYDMVSSLRPTAVTDRRFDVIVGPRGPIASADVCGGLQLPIAVANQVYSFTESAYINRVAQWARIPNEWAKQIFRQLLDLSDNTGQTDEHRAFNYLILRYKYLYTLAANMLRGRLQIDATEPTPEPEPYPREAYSLVGVTLRPAEVQGTRRIVEAIFNYEQRSTREPVSWFCKVDTSGQFPFLARGLARYYPHA